MSTTRRNHYVPIWYQKGFLPPGQHYLQLLDLHPDKVTAKDSRPMIIDGQERYHFAARQKTPRESFWSKDLYTSFLSSQPFDTIEKHLFGKIDALGKQAVQAVIENDEKSISKRFMDFFTYLDAQKLRTPKGLEWLRAQYPNIRQNGLMMEMANLQTVSLAIWAESVGEIVSAKDASVKFLITDHPVTTYNFACPPEHKLCEQSSDPPLLFKSSQTLFPLDQENCLILTNLEYARDREKTSPLERKSYPRRMGYVFLDGIFTPRERSLSDDEVIAINYVLKSRAKRYIAAGKKEWLEPEIEFSGQWKDVQGILLPDKEIARQRSDIVFTGHKKGFSKQHGAQGYAPPETGLLDKEVVDENTLNASSLCGCASGKKYEDCCKGVSATKRPSWSTRSIRERSIAFRKELRGILGINSSYKNWNDVRRNITPQKISDIHEVYGLFWPLETDIFDLLPKHDGRSRVIYSGVLDHVRTPYVALNAAMYFGDVMMVNPMVRPGQHNEKYCPVANPKMFIETTLGHALMFLKLYPLIESGRVMFFPDPSAIDPYLQSSLLSFSQKRKAESGLQIRPVYDYPDYEKKEGAGYKIFANQIVAKWHPQQIKRKLMNVCPELSGEQAELFVQITEKYLEDNLCAPLSDDVSEGNGKTGEMFMISAEPTFEILMLIAQATGANILTDILYRWEELGVASHRKDGEITPRMPSIARYNARAPFLHQKADIIWFLEKLMNNEHAEYRNWIAKLHTAIHEDGSSSESMLTSTHGVALSAMLKGLKIRAKNNGQMKIRYSIPNGGMYHKHVSRLMVKYGILGRDKVPAAIFMDIDWKEEESMEDQVMHIVRQSVLS